MSDFKILVYSVLEQIEKKAEEIMQDLDWLLKCCVKEEKYSEFKRIFDAYDKVLTCLPAIVRYLIELGEEE